MRLSDETLMAYADGELDDNTRGQVELAMQADPGVAARVRQHIALRQEVFRAFSRSLDGPVPPPPQALAGKPPAAAGSTRPKVVQLDSVRAARRQPAASGASGASAPSAPSAASRRWSPTQWAALAASLVVGVAVGVLGVISFHSETQFAAVNGDGVLRAHGKLDAALTTQLASAPQPRGALRIGVSFVARDGQYCRSFELGSAAGLACRAGAGWNIPVMVEGQGGAMPPAVLAAIDARAVGPSLDAAAEQAAARRAWNR